MILTRASFARPPASSVRRADRDDRTVDAPGSRRRVERRLAMALACALLGLAGCSSESDSRAPASPAEVQASPAELARAADPRPSVVLVVLDTTRADAISAYGGVEGTTPNVDRLAADGTLFAHAFAPSPWTVSSHASLFSGLRVDEHGVGLGGVYRSDDALEMLAEKLSEAGYVTAAFTENALVSAEFGLDQGFDHFESADIEEVMREHGEGDHSTSHFALARKVESWNDGRDRSRPFFLFVNIMDSHNPYSVRAQNPWVPTDAERSEVEFVGRRYGPANTLCRSMPRRDLEILRGLYLGDVAAADAKLGDVLDILDENRSEAPRITIVTADHGEHLGEHRLLGHIFSVRMPSIHIPLVVSGVESLAPGLVEAPVELRSLRQSLLCWALGTGCPAMLGSARESTPESESGPIYSIWSDRASDLTDPLSEMMDVPDGASFKNTARAACGPTDPVHGDLVSLIRFPMKMNWLGGLPPTLHDLRWDPMERSNLAKTQPEVAKRLLEELEPFVETRVLTHADSAAPAISEDAARALKALGYAE